MVYTGTFGSMGGPMAIVGKFVTHDNGVNLNAKVVQILCAGFYPMPLLTETLVEVYLRSSKPRVDDDIKPFIFGIRRR